MIVVILKIILFVLFLLLLILLWLFGFLVVIDDKYFCKVNMSCFNGFYNCIFYVWEIGDW